MECLLIGGAPEVGKSNTIYRIALRLRNMGFKVIAGNIPIPKTGTVLIPSSDFRAVLEGVNNQNKTIKIIINSPTDTVDIINTFKKFYDGNGGTYNILISSVRDDNFWPRSDFFRIMNINSSKDFILEIPLAKITRKKTNRPVALNWYELQLDNLIKHTLSNRPYNI